ncbi:hypothetical protein [Brevundimonas goettingensis]|uniref:Uncharacterized protein n=1 Tax=Brevundimonas goettingensis TaxID=2774190 RepID=A0A975C1W2_9CAUL|nr:hypothetical protein [Brevundimonas goettingensis]QTC92326.1 hypothetical protein IFJ75_05380 [Brevundimonas goettingensis]
MSNISTLPTASRSALQAKRALGAKAARELRTAEHQLDHALASHLALAQTLVMGRLEIGVAAAAGQEALAELTRAIGLAVEARGATIRAHEGLLQTAEEFSVPWRMESPTETKPGSTAPLASAVG